MLNARQLPVLAALVTGLALCAPAGASINKSVSVEDGATSGGESSVNGSITVGSDATVTGSLNTVNGKIRIGDRSVIEDARTVNGSVQIGANVTADAIETVNGSIEIEEETRVEGDVTAVNGSIEAGRGTQVGDDLSNVNGDIELTGSEIGGSVSTVSGDVELAGGAVIRGDLVVEKPQSDGWFNRDSRKPTITIGPGSRVEGVIRLEREVNLNISETAEVGGVEGVMSMDDAQRFGGERP